MIFYLFLVVLLPFSICFDFTNWKFIQKIEITNSGGQLIDEQVVVVINTLSLYDLGKMRSLCEDMRFLDDSGIYNELEYFIESGCNEAETSIWIKVPVVKASGQQTYIYMVHGNHLVSGGSLVFGNSFIVPSTSSCSSPYATRSFSSNYIAAGTFGTTGGSLDHSHTVSGCSIGTASGGASQTRDNGGVSFCSPGHSHSGLNVFTQDEGNTPAARRVRFCESPSSEISGAGRFKANSLFIFQDLNFESAYPFSVSRYSTLDNRFLKDGGTSNTGSTGTHTHVLDLSTTSTCSPSDSGWSGSGSSRQHHSHTSSDGTSTFDSSQTNEPPYINVIWGRASVDTIPRAGMIVASESVPPMGWTSITHIFNNRLLRGASTFGGMGGTSQHDHSTPTAFKTSYLSADDNGRPEMVTFSIQTGHDHQISGCDSKTSAEDHVPSYIELEFIVRNDSLPSSVIGEYGICGDIPGVDSRVCNGKGSCDDFDSCICQGFYSGQTCESWTCYFYDKDNTENVCSGEGDCLEPGNDCDCHGFYSGLNCESFSCNGIDRMEHDVCSNHGDCSSPNHCDCISTNYTGSWCEEWQCYSIDKETSGVCSNHGTCEDNDLCNCDMFFWGNDCSEWFCFGYVSTDTANVCSGHGTCTAHNTCFCDTNYIGNPDCSTWNCNGLDRYDPNVCNRHGTCTEFDVCDCENGSYEGVYCEWKCGIFWNHETAQVCNGNGQCSSPDACSCNGLYSGAECDSWFCYGYEKSDNSVCSSHGTCQNPNSCVCDTPQYSGDACQEWTCDSIDRYSTDACKSHGDCTSHNTCVCDSAAYDPVEFCNWKCDVYWQNDFGNVCSGHGVCGDVDTCICDSGYGGVQCNTFSCWGLSGESACGGHGQCVGNNICSCQNGYKPSNCDEWTCDGVDNTHPSVCSRRGECVAYNNCVCSSNSTGTYCDEWTCFDVANNNTEVCSSHGDCYDVNACACDLYYSGTECDEYNCWGISTSSPKVCSSHGYCSAKDECVCESEYFGDSCEDYTCFGEPNQSPSVCSGHGICAGVDFCECESADYTSLDCSEYMCFEKSNKNPDACSGNGDCVLPEVCECFSTHTGSDCSVYACFGIAWDHPNVCYRSGDCVDINVCKCTQPNTFGLECSESIFDARYSKLNEVLVTFSIPIFLIEGKDEDFEDCVLLVENVKEFPKDVSCKFVKKVATTSFLNVTWPQEKNKKKNDHLKWITLHPVTTPTVKVRLKIAGHPDDIVNENAAMKVLIPTISVGVPIIFVILVVSSVAIVVLCCLYLKKRKFVKRVEKIEDLDILLEETEISGDKMKLKINKKFFEIDADDLILKKEIGCGGSGTVIYLASSKSIGKDVVAKVFPTNKFNDDHNIYSEFQKEVALSCSINHPHVLQVMEFAVNGSLSIYMMKDDGKAVEMKTKLRWLVEICSGMAFLVDKGIIHRDLKPDNVLLNESLNCKIIDFGLSKILDSSQMTKMVGTSIFMAPEVVLSSGTYDFKVDVFSLAIIMWIFLYDDNNPYGRGVSAGVESRVARNSDFRPKIKQVPTDMEWYVDLMKKNWSHSPSDRFDFNETKEIIMKNQKKKQEVGVLLEERVQRKSKAAPPIPKKAPPKIPKKRVNV